MSASSGKERFDQARLINIANALTAIRVVLVPLFAHLLIAGRVRWSLAVFVVCGLSDGLDGLLARLLKQRTIVGYYLDPIADKLLMATSFIVLAYVKILPEWLTVLVISRDLFILVGSVLILLLLGSENIRATALGKLNTAVQILTVVYFLTIRAFPWLANSLGGGWEQTVSGVVVGVCALVTAASGVHYMAIGFKQLSDA
ncbi:MAG: CDP-alcohol phosphatidyltransferase family protein [Deltaproteobacteria bacterium]|nr:CDP-alcohol phosphatidyltransferase family protein [Deltaproteobacteria bacterium]PWB61676.1 MAG: CDP-diacylglycerol--glycerol-3-phosphate 3-phosphatidyltransferase [Deltaproteobacteria bacterium]